jgi:hypothetical protein
LKVGITGTHKGATEAQLEMLGQLLKLWGATRLDHGDCVGADSQGHDVARSLGLFIAVHPPEKRELRAFRKGDLAYPLKPYLVRDRHIVDCTERLVALPDSLVERIRSGTWYTVRYARRLHRDITIIGPDGRTYRG